MKVLHVMDRLNTGGAAVTVILTAKHMNPGGSAPDWSTTLVVGEVGADEGSMEWLAQSHGVRFEKIPSLGRELHPLRDAATLGSLIRIIRRERPDVVHTHKSKAGALGRLAARLCGVPVVVHTFHGHVLHGYFGEAKSRAFRLIERALAALSDRVIAVSPQVKDDLLRYRVAADDKIAVIPLGLDLARFARAPRGAGGLRAELGCAPGAPLVGIVARLVPIKNIPLFLEAAALVRREFPGALFAVAGDGELRGELEAAAVRLGVADAVRFLGFRPDLERVYPDLDVLCLASDNEGSPVSLIEGLASGCAAVSTDAGGARDVLEDGRVGVVVPRGDARALADAVAALLRDPQRRERLGEAGREAAPRRFSIERLVGDLDSLYRLLLERRQAARPPIW
jgi:glycosyltransferase involved in cell wall biosynthesis